MKLSIKTFFLASAFSPTAHAAWREDLPWSDLEENLSDSAILVDASAGDYLAECGGEYDKPVDSFARSNHGLQAQPSGLCLPHFFCAFNNCMVNPDQPTRSITDGLVDTANVQDTQLYSEINSTIKGWIDDTSNPMLNLPTKVLFPTSARDVVAATRFAKDHGLEISVKNSGHSYTNASSKGNTLLVNMHQYIPYATNLGPIDCDPDALTDSLEDQPCKLSLAKNKTAVIRVGGGENWGQVYKSIQNANKAQSDGYKYHVTGGAAATVSPMGWTFSGGLSGTTAGRTFGFGVDQVLQLEMVLPNGQHVKFGPTEWEEVEGYDMPKTLAVTGLCNAEPFETDESKWVWEDCPEEIPFDDLWFAVRGGGGGSWGIVTSIYLQLHEYMPLERVSMKYSACVADELDDDQAYAWSFVAQTFEIKFLLDPASINVAEADSNACGWPMGDNAFNCYGDGSGARFNEAWKTYLSDNRQSLEDAGISSDIIDEAIACGFDTLTGDTNFDPFSASTAIMKFNDYLEAVAIPDNNPYYPGLGMDIPQPGYGPTFNDGANVLVPANWILENIDLAASLIPPNPYSYRAFGGKTKGSTNDQLNSLSDAHRNAGYMISIPHAYNPDEFFSTTLPAWYDTTDEDDFPGYIGGNHAGMNTRGPLKSDWTKACPLEWTKEERDEKCISLQEIIWGTKTLKRLEAIKEIIDPNYMFDCNGCVGNNLRKDENVASASPSSGSALTVAIEDIMDPNYTIDSNGCVGNDLSKDESVVSASSSSSGTAMIVLVTFVLSAHVL